MGGRLWLESEEGKGSTFHFIIRTGIADDVAADATPAAARQLRPDGMSLRLLLAEDNRVNQRVAMAMLERDGHVVTIVDNGAARRRGLADESDFDVILMDVQMPVMSGFEATAAIRAREQTTGGHVPIVAMTAHAMQGDRERCLAAGMDGYVTKPLLPESFARRWRRRSARQALNRRRRPFARRGRPLRRSACAQPAYLRSGSSGHDARFGRAIRPLAHGLAFDRTRVFRLSAKRFA